MKRKKITYRNLFFHLLMMLTILPSCKKSFSPDQVEENKLVILAEITASDSIEVPIGKTIKVGLGNIIRFEKVNDAVVKLTEDNLRSWMLQPNSSAQFGSNPTTVFTSRRRFRANSTYSIEIKHPQLGTATATTHIPDLPKMISMDTAYDIHLGKEVLTASITWQDEVSSDENYIIEAVKELVKLNQYFYYQGIRYSYEEKKGKDLYEKVKTSPGVKLLADTVPLNKFVRLNLYTDDDNSDNVKIDNRENPFRRIFIPDKNFNGQIYTTNVFIDRQYFTSNDPKQKGRVRIQLKSVSKELYDYLILYEKYKTDFGSVPTSQLSSPVGNILNGLGVFGGSSRRERIIFFDTF